MFKRNGHSSLAPTSKRYPTCRHAWVLSGCAAYLIFCLAFWTRVIPEPCRTADLQSAAGEAEVVSWSPEGEDAVPGVLSDICPGYQGEDDSFSSLPNALRRIWRVQRRFLPAPVALIDRRLEAVTPAIIWTTTPV